MKLELPPISQKKVFFFVFFLELQTLIILQHRNQLNLYNFGGSDAPPGHSPLHGFLHFFFFFVVFLYVFSPRSRCKLDSFHPSKTQFRKTKAFTNWHR